MKTEYQERVFDGFQSTLRDLNGADPPCAVPGL